MVCRPRTSARSEAHNSSHEGKISSHTNFLDFDVTDVIAAVKSLYADEVKPFGRVILKRLRELAAEREAVAHGMRPIKVDPDDMPRIDPRRLRKVCDACRQFQVFPEEGREYSVLLKGEQGNFVDVRSSDDPYSYDFWLQVADYFENLDGDAMRLPGGRYACARILCARRLSFFAGLSLGQVCHVVQLAISKMKILGYLEGHLVPFHASEERKKEQCAMLHRPFAQRGLMGEEKLRLASWEDVQNGLWELLKADEGEDKGQNTLALSNVKRLFRSQLKVELSETALGHSRLHDLLGDPMLEGVCVLQTAGSGQVFVAKASGEVKEEEGLPADHMHKNSPALPMSMTCQDLGMCDMWSAMMDTDVAGPYAWADMVACEMVDTEHWNFAGSYDLGSHSDQSTNDDGLECRGGRVESGDSLDFTTPFGQAAAGDLEWCMQGEAVPTKPEAHIAGIPSSGEQPSSLLALLSPTFLSTKFTHVKNTFIHIEEPCADGLGYNFGSLSSKHCRRSRRSSQSLPPDFGSDRDNEEVEVRKLLPRSRQ